MRSSNRAVDALRALASESPLVLRVRGDCMAPELPDGAQVAVAPARRYWPGEVVAFGSAPEQLTLHRVIGWRWLRGRVVVVTQADSGATADSPIVPEAIVGRVRGLAGEGGALHPVPTRRARALGCWFAYLARGAARRLRRGLGPAR